MKVRLFAAIALSLASLNGLAIEPAKRQSIDAMFEAADMPALMENAQGTVAGLFKQQAAQLDISDQQRQVVEKYFARLSVLLKEELSWAALKDALAEVYDQAYTQDEIDGLTAFYRTPVGRKLVEKTPALVGASQAIMQEKMKSILPRIQQISADMAQELHPPAAAASAPLPSRP